MRGLDGVAAHWQHEAYLGAFAERAVGFDAAVVREHGLPRNGETKAGPAGLRSDVRIPDARQTIPRNAAAGVRDRNFD
jgi:hypothetical protein